MFLLLLQSGTQHLLFTTPQVHLMWWGKIHRKKSYLVINVTLAVTLQGKRKGKHKELFILSPPTTTSNLIISADVIFMVDFLFSDSFQHKQGKMKGAKVWRLREFSRFKSSTQYNNATLEFSVQIQWFTKGWKTNRRIMSCVVEWRLFIQQKLVHYYFD